jgi:hypothetical protein
MGSKMIVVVIGAIVIAVIVLTVISILDYLAMKKFDRHHL